MTKVKGLDFNECFKLSKIFEVENVTIRVLHLNNLIQAKKEAGRLKDFDDIEQLTKKKTLYSLDIRLATVADAGLIADLSRKTFIESFAVYNTKENMDKFMNERFTKEALIEEVGKPENIFLLAYLDKEAVGYVRLRDGKTPIELSGMNAIEIARIYTKQETIGKGIGKALMLECLSIAKEKNKALIWLGVWEHNANAIAFYKKFGFEEFGSHIFMLGNDVQTDFLMKRSI